MGKFTTIPKNTFDEIQMDAGMLLTNFDPANPAAPADADILCATTGGVNITCVPTYSDWGEDVDNVPNNMKELKHLDGWDCGMSFSSISAGGNSIHYALGAADVTTLEGTTTSVIKPRRDLEQTDFRDLWWVGDKANGGMVAVKLKNALSTGGFTLQTTKNGKGQISLELTGHVSMAAQKDMPMEFYVAEPESNGGGGGGGGGGDGKGDGA